MAEYDHNLVIDMQLKFLLKAELPFHVFSVQSWTDLCQEFLQPAYERVSKNTIKRLAFKYYISAKKDLVKYFQTFKGKVTLSITVWDTAYISTKYVCVTCHWIDPETYKLSKRTVSIRGEICGIHEIVTECVSNFKLEGKILSICFDDVDKKGMKMLKEELSPVDMLNGSLFETKCVSGILISMVKTCLDFAGPVVEKFRKMLGYACFYKRDEFVEILIEKGVRFKDPELSIPDVWDTTYKMLRGILDQKEILLEFYSKCCENDIVDNEWGIIESLLGILKVFYDCTVKLCGDAKSKKPTAHLVLEEILVISKMLKEYKQDPFWKPLVLKMQGKFLNYYKRMSPVYLCAAALNPTIGVMGVKKIMESIAENLELSNDFAEVGFSKFTVVLQEMFDYYHKMHTSKSKSGDISDVSSGLSELELYKSKDFSKMTSDGNENIKILKWWRTDDQYPVLGMMACDILTVKASAEPLEYVFCLNGRALDEQTSKPYPWWLQRRVFLKEHFETIGWEPTADVVEDGLQELEGDGDDEFDGSSDEEEEY